MNILENTLIAGLMAAAEKSPKAMERAQHEFAVSKVLPLAKDRTPVDYGTLRDSGMVEKPKWISNTWVEKIVVTVIGFGGAAAHYAIYVHEDLEAKHEVGQAKFLESALNDMAGMYIEHVSESYWRAMGAI